VPALQQDVVTLAGQRLAASGLYIPLSTIASTRKSTGVLFVFPLS
jgi:hypothetical protein